MEIEHVDGVRPRWSLVHIHEIRQLRGLMHKNFYMAWEFMVHSC